MNKIATGIDVGTYHVKVVIAQRSEDSKQPPHILGTGYAESRGLRHGYTISVQEAARGIKAALRQAESAARIKVKEAYLGIGGEGLDEALSRGEAVVERGDSEVTERDMQRAIAASEQALSPALVLNRRIIHTIPLRWSVDGTRVLGKNPTGMKGQRVAVETLFITAPARHIEDLSEAVALAGVAVADVIASPIAASFVTLTKMQKRVGCVLANIGSETLSIAVFEDDLPISLKVFPGGSADIGGDIALGLKIPLEEAEQLKHGAVLGAPYSRRKLDDIVSKRVAGMFKLVEAHLKKIGKDELLPAGIILTGGGSGITTITDIAQAVVRLPARIAPLAAGEAGRMQLRDGSWAVAYGLTIWGLTDRDEYEVGIDGSFGEALGQSMGGFWRFLKKFLP
ncbi:MAG: cell division protein FtsA [Patescibacteria group bacterium]|nr:cell division protein FtsA [Patescibacteria group bacterium]